MTPAERGAQVRFPPPLVFLSGVLLGVTVDRFVIAGTMPFSRAISVVIGLLVLMAGASLIVSARIHFTRTGQSPIPWKPSPALIAQGPYRFTRNPMYLGATLIEVGLGLALNNLWIVAFAIPALLFVHLIAVLPEERYLTDKFGESYRNYLRQVRRYI